VEDDLVVDLDQLLKKEICNAYWVVDDGQDGDAMVFTNLNLSKAEKAIEEMGIMEQGNRPETIFVDFEAADQITPDVLEKIILDEDKADWPEDLDERIERSWHMQKKENKQ
jgi:hypothetical protein